MRNTLMIDIETTGTDPGCKVLTIGAFGFDKNGQQVEFYKRFDPVKLHAEGFQDSVATMDWWTKQDKNAFAEAFGGTDDPAEGIGEFKRFCFQNFQMGKNDGFSVWCNGLDFDFPILKFFFQSLRVPFPMEILGPVRLQDAQEPLSDHQGSRAQRKRTQCS